MRRVAGLAALALAVVLLAAPGASARIRTFEGGCDLSGPITPDPGITILPHDGARFSFHGTGQCIGSLDSGPERTLAGRVDFVDVATFFDTCEVGPDVGLRGLFSVKLPKRRAVRFPITLNLVRILVAGPFVVDSEQGGSAFGFAQFVPANAQEGLAQCAGADGGLVDASLNASFQTQSPFMVRVPDRRRPRPRS